MNTNCCVPKCSNRSCGHAFPVDKLMRKKWLHAICRDKFKPTKHSRVCSDHFMKDDFVEQSWASKQAGAKPMKRLKKGSVPSVFQWSVKKPESAREKRMKAKEAKKMTSKSLEQVNEDSASIMLQEIEVENCGSVTDSSDDSDLGDVRCADAASQTEKETTCSDMSIEKFKEKPDVISYYTGLDDYDHFMLLLHLLGPAAHELNYGSSGQNLKVLDPRDCLFLSLIKLRRNTPNFELAVMFGISKAVVSKIFQTWLNFLYFEMKDWGIVPSDSKENDVKIILDCTEIKIERPSSATLQQATYSSYKGANTVKVLVGISPTCLVTFVSDAYGGSYSDNAILNTSGVLDRLSEGDVILADRGFHIEQMCADRGLIVNVPSSLRGKSQLSVGEMRKSTHISSRRIHVERVIGLAKTYHILQQKFKTAKVPFAGRIIFVCFMLANLRRRII